jgi:cell division septation protein DedD
VTEPRTHYQISVTSRQAVGMFAALLVALGVAYFLGLMTGLARHEPPGPVETEAALAPTSAPQAASSDALPPIETAVPTAGAPSAARAVPTVPPAEPTSPPTLQPFDDGSEEAAAPLVEAYPGKSPQAGAAKPGVGKYWVQVASLTSKQEAGALSGRLSKRGYRTQVVSADGPKGKGRVYRVRVGPYPSEDDAGKAAGKLSRQERIASPWVVPDGK